MHHAIGEPPSRSAYPRACTSSPSTGSTHSRLLRRPADRQPRRVTAVPLRHRHLRSERDAGDAITDRALRPMRSTQDDRDRRRRRHRVRYRHCPSIVRTGAQVVAYLTVIGPSRRLRRRPLLRGRGELIAAGCGPAALGPYATPDADASDSGRPHARRLVSSQRRTTRLRSRFGRSGHDLPAALVAAGSDPEAVTSGGSPPRVRSDVGTGRLAAPRASTEATRLIPGSSTSFSAPRACRTSRRRRACAPTARAAASD